MEECKQIDGGIPSFSREIPNTRGIPTSEYWRDSKLDGPFAGTRSALHYL